MKSQTLNKLSSLLKKVLKGMRLKMLKRNQSLSKRKKKRKMMQKKKKAKLKEKRVRLRRMSKLMWRKRHLNPRKERDSCNIHLRSLITPRDRHQRSMPKSKRSRTECSNSTKRV